MEQRLIHNLDTLHLTEATIEEQDSYYILTKYLNDKSNFIRYRYPDISLKDIRVVSNSYCVFGSKILDSQTQEEFRSYLPLGTLRYVLHEDMSYSNYYTPRRKPGYIVEAYLWTNGILYQVREEIDKKSITHEINLIIDPVIVKILNLQLPEELNINDNLHA